MSKSGLGEAPPAGLLTSSVDLGSRGRQSGSAQAPEPRAACPGAQQQAGHASRPGPQVGAGPAPSWVSCTLPAAHVHVPGQGSRAASRPPSCCTLRPSPGSPALCWLGSPNASAPSSLEEEGILIKAFVKGRVRNDGARGPRDRGALCLQGAFQAPASFGSLIITICRSPARRGGNVFLYIYPQS